MAMYPYTLDPVLKINSLIFFSFSVQDQYYSGNLDVASKTTTIWRLRNQYFIPSMERKI